MFDALTRKSLLAAITACFAAAGASAAPAAPALVEPSFLLPYGPNATVIDYRPAVNAAGTRIVFERQVVDNGAYSNTVDLYIADLASPPAQRLLTQPNSTRPDWCWYTDRPFQDGPIAFSNNAGVATVAPVAGSAPTFLANSANWIYPDWFADCRALAVYASDQLSYGAGSKTVTGPETLAVDAATGRVARSLSGVSLWAGFPNVNRVIPGVLAFAGQQFSAGGYDQNKNYVYLADFRLRQPATRPLDPGASTQAFDPRYQGRAPAWSPDGRWIAFESNRACSGNTSQYAVFVQDGLGRRPAMQITDCIYNAQHPKWFRHPVGGRTLLVTTALLHPSASAGQPLLRGARGIASLDVTAAVRP